MAISQDFLDFLQDQLTGLGHITARRMFSGAAIYCDGVVFALVLRDVLHFKVDDGNRDAYEAECLEPFIYQSRGKTVRMEAYRRVPERLFDDPDEMQTWARAALAAGRRSPSKKNSKRAQRPRR
jgi:DNA transformation protein and related proteins